MFKEFRDFAIKGNMIDLAIGVIIGAAFGAIVSSTVDDIMMPLFGLIIGGVDFSNLFIVLNNPTGAAVPSLAAAKEAGVATLNIGVFINSMVKFTIIAFVLFLVVKGINSMKKTIATESSSEEVSKTMAMAAPKAPSVSAAKKKTTAKAAVAPKPASKKAPAKKAKKAPAKKAKKAPAKKAGAKKAAAKKAPAKKAKKAAKRPAKKAAKRPAKKAAKK